MQPDKQDLLSCELNDFEIGEVDFNLMTATLEAIRTKTLTPIIKQELKLKIQTSRLAAGKDELPNSVFREPETYQLTTEEQELQKKRRERNRVAARKCRNKRKTKQECTKMIQNDLEITNHFLKRKIEELEAEIRDVKEQLKRQHILYEQTSLPAFSKQPLLANPTSLDTDCLERQSTVSCDDFVDTQKSISTSIGNCKHRSHSFLIPHTNNLPVAVKGDMNLEQLSEEQKLFTISLYSEANKTQTNAEDISRRYSAALTSPTPKPRNAINFDNGDDWMSANAFSFERNFVNEMQNGSDLHMPQIYSVASMPSPSSHNIYIGDNGKSGSPEKDFLKSIFFKPVSVVDDEATVPGSYDTTQGITQGTTSPTLYYT